MIITLLGSIDLAGAYKVRINYSNGGPDDGTLKNFRPFNASMTVTELWGAIEQGHHIRHSVQSYDYFKDNEVIQNILTKTRSIINVRDGELNRQEIRHV